MRINRKLKVAIVGLLVLALLSTAFASYLLTRQITNSMRMLGAAGMLLVREDNPTVEVTSIAWGDFSPLQSKTSLEILGTRIMFKNTGNVGILVGWNCTGLPADWTITAMSGSMPYPQNDFNQFGIAAGQLNGVLVFTLASTNAVATPGDYSFTLNFNVQPQT
jgi:hypothetical protein